VAVGATLIVALGEEERVPICMLMENGLRMGRLVTCFHVNE
jgi:hypothetical protein